MKRFKFLLVIIFIIVIGFTGCSPKVPEISQETLFFENTEWGMTKAEILEKLKLDDKDVVKSDIEGRTDIDTFVVNGYIYKNKSCDLFIGFSNEKSEHIKKGSLVSAVVAVDDKSFLENELAEYKEKFSDSHKFLRNSPDPATLTHWDSIKTYKDYIAENNVSAEDFFNYITKAEKSKFSADKMLEMLDEKTISSLRVELNDNPSAEGYAGKIIFDGVLYASVATFNR